MKVKCMVCGKEFQDVPGIPGWKRLNAHINAVHQGRKNYFAQVRGEDE